MPDLPDGLPQGSQHSLIEADKERGRFSDEKASHGAAGVTAAMSDLQKEPMAIVKDGNAFGTIQIDLSWDRVALQKPQDLKSFAVSLFKTPQANVDLDLGCLYELHNGRKGCLQAFGDLFGNYDKEPYIQHSGDERTGKSESADESLRINGAHWPDIKRVLIYTYIYQGVVNWNVLQEEITLRVGAQKIALSLEETASTLPICALMTLENEHDQIKLTRRLEYFAGHLEMDRAYGYGLQWEEGAKS